MVYALGTITYVTTFDGQPRERYEYLKPTGGFTAGVQGAIIYADEKIAKKLARQYRCKVIPIHEDYIDQLDLEA